VSTVAAGPGTFAADLRVVLGGSGFRRLLAVRLVGQGGDGVFQVALASLFFFSPERQPSAAGVAAAFAVLLLPFTLAGPWAGVLLDRWRRRQVLLWVNAGRALAVVGTAGVLLVAGPGPPLYGLVLACLSANRFLLAGLSASLPHVVPRHELVVANSVSPTSGSAAAFGGGAVAFALRPAVGHGDAGDVVLLLLAAGVYLAAAGLTLRIGASDLGPDRAGDAGTLGRVTRDLGAGLAHVRRRRTPALALGAIGGHRLAYGVSLIATVLLTRNRLADGDPDAALALLGMVVSASGAGFVLAAVVTPHATRRLAPQGWLVACLLLAAAVEAGLVAAVTTPLLVAGAFLLGLAGQGAKISVDTIVQRDVDDAYRGRVFVLYDVVFNAALLAAAALAVLVVPDDGYSRTLYAAIAAWYAMVAVVYRRAACRAGRRPPSPPR
jgi:MFS family permease